MNFYWYPNFHPASDLKMMTKLANWVTKEADMTEDKDYRPSKRTIFIREERPKGAVSLLKSNLQVQWLLRNRRLFFETYLGRPPENQLFV